MRILAFTDIHGAMTAVNRILAAEPPADVVLLGGDLTTVGTAADIEDTIRAVRTVCPQVFAVGGNMDPRALEKTISELGVSLDGRGVILGEVGFFGISGAPLSPLLTPHEMPESELLATAERGWQDLGRARVRILVSHAPPHDTEVDRLRTGLHVGSIAVRTFIEEHHPDVVVCGHIHESFGVTSIGSTRIVNCGAAGQGHFASIVIGDGIEIQAKHMPPDGVGRVRTNPRT
jgi:uncharacterized protein